MSVANDVSAKRLSDQSDITRRLYLYARAVDGKNFDLFDEIFTADAEIHYDLEGGTKLPQDRMREWLGDMLQIFRATQHAISNPIVDVDGDLARSTCYLVGTHEQIALDGRRAVFTDHGVYADAWVRTSDGWRCSDRRLTRLVLHGDFIMPDDCQRFAKAENPAWSNA